jgi:hypothetical protein
MALAQRREPEAVRKYLRSYVTGKAARAVELELNSVGTLHQCVTAKRSCSAATALLKAKTSGNARVPSSSVRKFLEATPRKNPSQVNQRR